MDVIAVLGYSGQRDFLDFSSLGEEYNADIVLADGLLIRKGRVMAGLSARQAPNPVAAVRRSLFSGRDHAKAVRNQIVSLQPERVLLVAGSRKAADKIARVLRLPKICEYVDSSILACREEYDRALEQYNRSQGDHIRVAADNRKKTDGKMWLRSLGGVMGRNKTASGPVSDKSAVLPLGDSGQLVISGRVLGTIMLTEAGKAAGVARIRKIKVSVRDGAVYGEMSVDLKYGCCLPDVFAAIRANISQGVLEQAGMRTVAIVLLAADIEIPDNLVGSGSNNPV